MALRRIIAGTLCLSFLACATPGFRHGAREPATASGASRGASSLPGGELALPLDEAFGPVLHADENGAYEYRVESYGGTVIQLNASGSADSALRLSVSGPWFDLAGDALGPSPATAGQSAGEGQAHLLATLGAPGVYRVFIQGSDTFSANANCLSLCTRPSVPVSKWMSDLRSSGRLPAFEQFVLSLLGKYVSDPALREQLAARFQAILQSGDFGALDRFPVINLRQAGRLRAALAPSEQQLVSAADAQPPAPPQVFHGELEQILGACSSERPLPDPISAAFPDVRYGDYNSMAMSDCQFDQSGKIAALLTSLAAGNGTSLTYAGTTIQTPSDLIRALIQTGHRIEMRNEKTYANFLSFMLTEPNDPGSSTLKWPVWVDTGVALKDGSHLIVPMGHSQHAWLISGPWLNVRVTYFLGMFGTGFFAENSVRAGWTGLRAAYRYDSGSPADLSSILKAFDEAALYSKRNLIETSTVAKGLSADGYGYLGVCNDSTALLEGTYRGTDTSYPLVRAKSLSSNPTVEAIDDGLGQALDGLPHDADNIPDVGTAAGRQNVLRRIAWMIPYPLDSDQMVDEDLRAQYKRLLSENPTLRACIPR